ncbi:DUF4190 domain-containing protein [Arthrobacter sp. ISL-30]|uniref:DUF4190 domain-containing protein n=1 Tax=Arthrobacter sp. ISL-30 TaxID=2819109 RepID=UPI001BEBF262|nr:DUF4190 domain-containing protein [Arthrobacter sp. ISL-30]MBT2513399.1 DUF4190 domain-containing protein [Arthrobacter sp. ISL-30]
MEPLARTAPPVPAAPESKRGNGFGTAALVLGILAIVFSIIPIAGFIAFVLGPLAVIFGVIGLTRKFSKKGTAAAGLILGVLAVIVAIIVTAVISAAAQSVSDSLNKEHKIGYVVTVTGKAHVSYWTEGGMSTEDITGNWNKDVTSTGFSMGSVTVTGDYANPTTVTCEILVDGQSVAKNSGSGTSAMASCSGSSSSIKK